MDSLYHWYGVENLDKERLVYKGHQLQIWSDEKIYNTTLQANGDDQDHMTNSIPTVRYD